MRSQRDWLIPHAFIRGESDRPRSIIFAKMSDRCPMDLVFSFLVRGFSSFSFWVCAFFLFFFLLFFLVVSGVVCVFFFFLLVGIVHSSPGGWNFGLAYFLGAAFENCGIYYG